MAKEVKKLKLKDLVTVYGTGKGKHMPKGKAFEVHSHLAETLIEKGAATKTKPKSGAVDEEEKALKASKGKKAAKDENPAPDDDDLLGGE